MDLRPWMTRMITTASAITSIVQSMADPRNGGPEVIGGWKVRRPGIEPGTTGLKGRCSAS